MFHSAIRSLLFQAELRFPEPPRLNGFWLEFACGRTLYEGWEMGVNPLTIAVKCVGRQEIPWLPGRFLRTTLSINEF